MLTHQAVSFPKGKLVKLLWVRLSTKVMGYGDNLGLGFSTLEQRDTVLHRDSAKRLVRAILLCRLDVQRLQR